MNNVCAALHGTLARRLHVRSFIVGLVVLFLVFFTLILSSSQSVNADASVGETSAEVLAIESVSEHFDLPVAILAQSDLLKWAEGTDASVATISSRISGSWGDPGTWNGGIVPGPGDNVTITTGTTVTLDTARSAKNLTINFSAELDLNGNAFDLQGNGAVFTSNGSLTNTSATFNTFNFAGNGTINGVTQFFGGTNAGCSFATICNLQVRLTNAVVVSTISGTSVFNLKVTIDLGSILNLANSLTFIGSFSTDITITNNGAIKNGRLTTDRRVIISGGGLFESELVVESGTTQFQGDLKKWVALGSSTPTLKLTGNTNMFAGMTMSSGSTFDINGKSLHFFGNNSTFSNAGATIANSGVPTTVYFEGNGTAGAVTQHFLSFGPFANNITVRCSSSVILMLDQNALLPNVFVETGSTFDLAGHTLALTGPGEALTVQGTILTTGSTIEMNGTAAQSVQTNLNGASYNNLTINNPAGVNIPNPGANPMTVPGKLSLMAGLFSPNGNLTMGNGSTIERSYGTIAATPIIASMINILYSGFSTITSGPEIPAANVINNFQDSDGGTVTINSDIIVNGSFQVDSDSNLTGSAGRSLVLKGSPVFNVGSVFYPNVTFDSSGIQIIGNYGSWTGDSVAIVGTGGVSLATHVNFSSVSFTNTSTINTGTNFLHFNGSTFTNSGVINGNVQTEGSNVFLDTGATGFNAAFTVFSGMVTAKGKINSNLTIQSSAAVLQVNAGESLTVTGNCSVNGPLSGGGTFRANGSNVANSALVSVADFQLGGVTQSLSGNGSFSVPVTILSGSSTTLGANKQLTYLSINAGGSINLSNRTLTLSGTGMPITNAGVFTSSTGTVEYNGTSAQSLSSTVPVYFNLSLNNMAGANGFAGLTVNGLLRVKAGSFTTDTTTSKDIQIDNGAALAGTNGTTVTLTGNWTNNGTFTPSGNIVSFSGSTAQTIAGTAATTFHNLTTSGVSIVNLGQNITVSSNLTLGKDLNTGANTLAMPATGTSAGGGDVIGNVKRSGFVEAGPALSFGNPFNSIAFSTGGTLPSDVTFNLAKTLAPGFPNGVQRSYIITPTGGSGFAATVRLHYLDSELNGNIEASLKLFRFNGTWDEQGAIASDSTNNWVEQSNVTQFSPWTLSAGPAGTPSPTHTTTSTNTATPTRTATITPTLTPSNTATPVQTPVNGPSLVISQIYNKGGSGGNSSYFKYNYVEIKNLTQVPQTLNLLKLYYGGLTANFATTTSNAFDLPNVTLAQGQYFLVQVGPPNSGGIPFNVPADVTTPNLNISGGGVGSGKVALVTGLLPINTCGSGATPCSVTQLSYIVDWVAWGAAGNGTAGNGEGGTSVNNGAALLGISGSVRKEAGCRDTNNNNLDFDVIVAPEPRNSSSIEPCVGPTATPSGTDTTTATPTPTVTPTNTSTPVPTVTGPMASPSPTVTNTASATPTATSTPPRPAPFDYDGDRKTDISVFRPSTGAWYLLQSQAGLFGAQFGFGTDKITPADFDGDGKTDIAVYRPSDHLWYVLRSSDGTVQYYVFGLVDDLPTPADYDGDGKADVAVFRASTGTWYRQNSGNGTFFAVQFGASEDKPTVGDFDGDGKSDVAVFRPSTGAWYQIYSSDGSIHGENFGFGTDVLVPADYDGDGKMDVAVFRPSDGYWYARNSSDGVFTYKIFGLANDIPAPGDFDGDGHADINVFRPSDGTWYRQNSSNGQFVATPFGTNGDKPTHAAYRY